MLPGLLEQLDQLGYYRETGPKSLANEFGTDTVLPLVKAQGAPVADLMRTYVEHIAGQIARSVAGLQADPSAAPSKMLVTGGGAFHAFLIERLREKLAPANVELALPDNNLIQYKEALIMALIGILRWREEVNVYSSVTGARRDSVGGGMWL